MKGLIIGQRISANLNDFNHGGGTYVKRLIFVDPGICVNIVDNQVFAFFGFEISKEEFDLFGQVEISQETFEEILKVARLNEELSLAGTELLKKDDLVKSLTSGSLFKRSKKQ